MYHWYDIITCNKIKFTCFLASSVTFPLFPRLFHWCPSKQAEYEDFYPVMLTRIQTLQKLSMNDDVEMGWSPNDQLSTGYRLHPKKPAPVLSFQVTLAAGRVRYAKTWRKFSSKKLDDKAVIKIEIMGYLTNVRSHQGVLKCVSQHKCH